MVKFAIVSLFIAGFILTFIAGNINTGALIQTPTAQIISAQAQSDSLSRAAETEKGPQ